MSNVLTVLCPLTPHNSTCGYCGPPGVRSVEKSNCHAAELIPTQLSCQAYQEMIDRGWRRSGTYCYKPDLLRSCCPQYTIRLDALAFKASKSQRKLVNRFNRWVIHGDDDKMDSTPDASPRKGSPSKHKGKKSGHRNTEFVLTKDIHCAEIDFLDGQETAHRLEVTLEKSSYTQEKFELFQCYQREVHHEHEKSPDGFNRFLVEAPFAEEPIPYPSDPPKHLPKEYAAYHQLYRLDGELVAVGVIDILPSCVSSVYFMYNNKWDRFSLGKISALREITLAKEIHDAGISDMKYLYMGFYVHSCPKMRYKGEYSPSYLADPQDYTWHPFEECKVLLDRHHYACFTHPEKSLDAPFKGPLENPTWSESDLGELYLVDDIRGNGIEVVPVILSQQWKKPAVKRAILTVAEALGPELAKKIIFHLNYVL